MGRGLNGTDTSPEAVRGRMRLLVLATLVCAFQFYINLPVLDHGWVDFDDDINIVLNPHLTGGSSDTFQWAWSDASYNRRYMPLGWMMFDGLFRLGGLNPVLYHTASWLLAAANSVVLFLIARRFVWRGSNLGRMTGWQDLSSALAVILLSVHPLRAETVGWASGLLYLGSTFLASLAVLASFPLRSKADYSAKEWLGRLLFLLSLLIYPVHVGLPLLLIVAAASSLTGGSGAGLFTTLRQATQRYAVWLILAVLIGGWNIVAAAASRTFASLNGTGDYTFGSRLAHAASMLGHYVSQILWPATTSPFYGEISALPVAQKFLLPFGALGVWLILIAWPRTRLRAALLLAACLAAVLPFTGLVDKSQGANDRYTFLLLAVLAVGLAGLLAKAGGRNSRVAATVALLAVTALLLPSYHLALAVWRTTDSLQARIDRETAPRPDVRLGFARPAMNEFLRGHYVESQQRLKLGFARFGAHPELIGAATFIEETRTSLTGDSRNPRMPPYAYLHLDLAKSHGAAGHAYAAKVHSDYAHLLMAEAGEGK